VGQSLHFDCLWTFAPAPQGVGVAIAGGRQQSVDSRERTTQLVDERQIAVELVAGDTCGGKPGLFGRQAAGQGADPYRCADEDAAAYLYFHALFDADAGAYAYLHAHAFAGDGNTNTDSNADTRRGNSRTADTHGDTITTTAATHQHPGSTTTHGYANSRGSGSHAHA
jgi:hypothetical protein